MVEISVAWIREKCSSKIIVCIHVAADLISRLFINNNLPGDAINYPSSGRHSHCHPGALAQ